MSDVTLNPPECKQRLSNERVAELGQIAAGMPHDVPAAGWISDLCADLLGARCLVERVAKTEPQGVIGHGYYGEVETGCRFCDEEDYGQANLRHTDDCPWILACKLIVTTK